VNPSVLFSITTVINGFKRLFVEIIRKLSSFMLDYETKLSGDSQSPSVMQVVHGLMPMVLVV